MNLSNIDDVKSALKLAGVRPNKSLGQHFLVNEDSLHSVVDAADLGELDEVLEVGPGLGVMTKVLTQRAKHVHAVEMDTVFAELLRRDAPDNLTVVEQDILKFDVTTLPSGYKVIANIPYYLTSRLIRVLTESHNKPQIMSLLIQKEVAERIIAKPGNMSLLSLSVQFYGLPTIASIVPRDHFWPAPAVDSAVLKIIVREHPAFEADASKLFRLMKAGFGEKRKQLKNSLSGSFNQTNESIAELLTAAELSATARAQELSLDEWKKLYDVALNKGLLG